MSFTQNKLHAKRWKTKTKQQFDIPIYNNSYCQRYNVRSDLIVHEDKSYVAVFVVFSDLRGECSFC
jgi:hypothetical protein